MIEPTVEREAVDRLLASVPGFDLLDVEWTDTWLIVELGQPALNVDRVWARHRYAIFRRTGAIHGVRFDGAVTDDPLPL